MKRRKYATLRNSTRISTQQTINSLLEGDLGIQMKSLRLRSSGSPVKRSLSAQKMKLKSLNFINKSIAEFNINIEKTNVKEESTPKAMKPYMEAIKSPLDKSSGIVSRTRLY